MEEEVKLQHPQEIILRVVDPYKRSILLDDDRENFCRHIVARDGIEESYFLVYNVRNGYEVAMKLLENPEVIQRIARLDVERSTMRNLTKESLIVGLKDIYDVSLADYFSEDFKEMKDSGDWTPAMRLAVKRIKPGRFGTEIEVSDKTVIADRIISMMGFANPAIKEKSDSEFGHLSDRELEEMATIDVEFEEVKETKKKQR